MGEAAGGSAPKRGGRAWAAVLGAPGAAVRGSPGSGAQRGPSAARAGPAGRPLGFDSGTLTGPIGVVAMKGNELEETAPNRRTFDCFVQV